jgi:hypothetical protein
MSTVGLRVGLRKIRSKEWKSYWLFCCCVVRNLFFFCHRFLGQYLRVEWGENGTSDPEHKLRTSCKLSTN